MVPRCGRAASLLGMQPWATGVGPITLFVEDLAAARTFYGDAVGLTVVYEDDSSFVVRLGSTLVNLLQVAAAQELIEPAAVAPSDSGARVVLTVQVEDVDAVCAQLAQRGVQLLNGPLDRPWGIRTASFQDPAGHIWELAH
jgi:lactoylglutathione lyase